MIFRKLPGEGSDLVMDGLDKQQTRLFRRISNIINCALLVLESPRGRATLSSLAQRIIKNLEPQVCIYPSTDRSCADMNQCINHFLEALRRRFPHVYLGYLEGHEAEFRGYNRAVARSTMEDFSARNSGSMILNDKVSSWPGSSSITLLPFLPSLLLLHALRKY